MATVRDVKRDLSTIIAILNNYGQRINALSIAISSCGSDLQVQSIIYSATELQNFNSANAPYIDKVIADINSSLEILLADYVTQLQKFKSQLNTLDVSELISDCNFIYENALISESMEGFWKYTPTHEDLKEDIQLYQQLYSMIPELIERASYWNANIVIKI